MKQQLENIRQLSLEQIAAATTPAEIDDIRVRVLGKKRRSYSNLETDGQTFRRRKTCYGRSCKRSKRSCGKSYRRKT